MIKTITKSLLWFISIILVLIPLTLYGLLGTENGCRLLLQKVLPATGIDASVEKVQGNLLSELHLTNLHYASDSETIELGSFIFSWNPTELFNQKLHIDRLSADRLVVEILKVTTAEPETDTTFSVPAIPISINLNQFSLTNFSIKNKDSETLIEQCAFSALFENNIVRLNALTFKMPEVSANGNGYVEITEQWPVSANLEWQLHGPELENINGKTAINGTLGDLRVTGLIDGLIHFNYAAQADLSGEQPIFSASAAWDKIQWPLTGPPQVSSSLGKLKVSGSLEQYRIELNTKIATDELPSFTLALNSKGNTESLTDIELLIQPKQGELNIHGNVNWAQAVKYDANISAKKINPGDFVADFPGSIDLIASTSGEIISGNVAAQVDISELKAVLKGYPLSATGHIGIKGDAYNVENLNVVSASNSLKLDGSLSRQEVDIKFDINAPNLSATVPGLSGSIFGEGNVSGNYNNPVIFSKINAQNLSYQDIAVQQASLVLNYAQALGEQSRIETQLQGLKISDYVVQNIELSSFIKIEDETYRFKNLKIQAEKNIVQLDGALSSQSADLRFDINAPDLRTAWPGLSGSISGGGSLSGQYSNPIIFFEIQAHDLHYQDLAIQNAQLSLNYAQALHEKSRLSTRIQGVKLADQIIDEITLLGNGSLEQHQLDAQLHSAAVKFEIGITGHLNKQTWNAMIPKLKLEHQQIKTWQIQNPIQLSLKPQNEDYYLDLDQACLYQDTAAICIAAHGLMNKHLEVHADAKTISLTMLRPWLPEQITLVGALTAEVELLKTETDLNAKVTASIPETVAKIVQSENNTLVLPFSATHLTADYQKQQLDAEVRIGLIDQDYLSASINAKPISDNKHSLAGNILAEITNIELIDAFVSEIEDLKGKIDANLTLSGNTDHPQIDGRLRFVEGGASVPLAGIKLTDLSLELISQASDTEQLALQGQVKSGQGMLNLDGFINLNAEQGFPVTANITGSDFQIAKMPEAEIYISPELKIEQNQSKTSVIGTVTVPNAKLKLTEIPESAIAPSEDEVIIGTNDSTNGSKSLPPIETKITIVLGDKVNFKGYGLKTDLEGKLQYSSDASKQNMQGRVAMKNAKYKAYGQDLSLTHGEFLFNGPVDNPWLNIEATRKATGEDVTAILRVTGPLKSPTTKVSTEPSSSESDALAYLLTGRSLQHVGGSQSGALAKAAFSYGAGQLSWLGDQMGIDDYDIEEGETLEDSAVRLGKYITPDFYIGLSMGFFSNTYAVLFKQQLTEHLSLQSKAGETQRIDLKYQLDTD